MISLIIGPGNVVSGNLGGASSAFPDTLGSDHAGIIVTGGSKGLKIRNNVVGIGEFPPGTPVASKLYGNAGDGIAVTVSDVSIGGTGASDGNVVAANGRHGILIKGSSTTGTQVIGNSIGVHPSLAGNLTLGNAADGIHNNGASTALIGGPGATDFNTIAGNGRNGVKFRNGNANNGWSNLLQRNKIYGNAKGVFIPPGVGIDLDFLEDLPNPLHNPPLGEFLGLSYAQLDQAQPVICTGAGGEPAACAGFTPPSAGGGTTLDWTIQTHGPATFRMEFFKIDTANPNTSTSMTFLGEQTITTDMPWAFRTPARCAGGRCSASVAGSAAGGYIVMTANDVTPITNLPGGGWLDFAKCIVFTNCFVNDTSEFSNTALPAIATTTAVTNVNPGTSVFGEPVSVTATVTAAAGAAPTGNVAISAGASSCNAVLGSPVGSASSGTCALAPNPAVGGPIAVTATYASQNGFLGSASSGAGNGSLTVNKASTTTAITADTPDPSLVNAPYSVTASVTVNAPGAGVPGGSITVTDGTDNCVITLPAAACNLTSTTTGAKTLTATYGSDASFNGSASLGVPHQVNPAGPTPTTTAVTLVAPATAVYGQTVSVTVQVTAGSGVLPPDGGVTVTAGASTCNIVLAPVVGLVSGGSCNLAPALAAQVAPYTVSAAYAGNAGFAGSASSGAGNGSLTVNKANTTTTITADTPDPSNVNAAYTVTVAVAPVAPGAGTPGGTITVSDGTDNCVITLPAPSCNLTSTTTGAKTLTATYAGDANFSGSVSPGASHQVNPVGPTTTTTAVTLVNPVTAVYGQTVAVTVQVTAGSGALAPDGGVTVTAGGSTCNIVLAPVAGLVSGGSCNLAPAPAAQVAPYTVSASYAGNASFAASASSGAGNGSLTVNKANTTTTITADTPDPSNVNAAYAVTVAVAAVAPGAGTPGGTITVSDGTNNCVITLPATSCNLTSTTTGAKTLTATYAGSANFNGSVSPGVPHQVNPGGATPTTTAVTLVAPASAVYGQAVNVTVQVTAGSGAVAPDGSITVTAGSSTCNATLAPVSGLIAGGSCALAPPPGAQVGAYTVTANYAGTATFAASASSGAGNGSLTVSKANTTTTITADTPDPSNVNAAYAVTVALAPVAPGSGSPGGTITVSDSTDNCVITLPAMSCNLTSTTTGAKTLTATYAGDANFTGSVSPGVPHQVNAGGATPTTTAVTLVNPTTAVYGQPVNVTVQVTAGSGAVAPDGSVTVTAGSSTCNATLAPVSGLIAGGSCALAPPPGAQVGAYTVTANYAGTVMFAASASSGAGNGSLTVNKASTTGTVSDAPDPSSIGVPYTVTASLSVTAPGAGIPSGTINVSDGVDSCVITLPATTCALTPTTAGTKTLTAQYGGDTNFAASSATTSHTANAFTSFTGPTVAPGVTGTATLSGGGPNCSFVNPQFIAVAPLSPPPGIALPFGLFDFNATGCTIGGTIQIQIVYSQALPIGTQYWKYGPAPGNLVPHWYVMPGSSVAGNTATFSITDGGFGDDDVTANGTIVDQGGPGFPAGPGGTAATTVEIPTLGEYALAMLALLLASMGALRLRRRM